MRSQQQQPVPADLQVSLQVEDCLGVCEFLVARDVLPVCCVFRLSFGETLRMALQTAAHAAAYTLAPPPATVPTFAHHVQVADPSLPGTSAALTSNQPLSAGPPSVYTSHLQSFPMVPPALSVMIPTNTTSQSYHNSPSATQVCSTGAYMLCTSLHAEHVSPGCICRWMCWHCV